MISLSYLILSLLAVCWRECYLFLDHRTICKQWRTASSSARQLFSYFAEYLSSCSCIIAFLFKDAFTSKMHSLQALSFPLYPSYQSSCLTFNHDSPIFPSRNHIPYSGECGLCSSSISASLLTSAPSTHAAVLSLTHLSCSPWIEHRHLTVFIPFGFCVSIYVSWMMTPYSLYLFLFRIPILSLSMSRPICVFLCVSFCVFLCLYVSLSPTSLSFSLHLSLRIKTVQHPL